MKKRISILIIIVLIVAQLVTVSAAVGSFMNTYKLDAYESLEGDINAMELAIAGDTDYAAIAREYQKAYGQNIRISFIGADGSVLADTNVNGSVNNHSDRPEIVQAAAGGTGRDTRRSASTGVETMYAAKRMANGDFLRIAMPVQNTYAFVLQAMPIIIIAFIVLTIIAIIFSNIIARGVLSPMNQLYASIKGYIEGESTSININSKYGELDDISRAFADISQRLNKYIARVKLENKKSSLILENIQEGLMVMDKDQDVLLINPAARRILGGEEDITNVNILHFTRKQEILNQIDKAFERRKSKHFDITDETTGKTYRYHLSFVTEEAFGTGGEGLLVLISDVTDIADAERMRKDFAANVSHELKTPLTSIDGYAQLIANGMTAGEEETRGYAQRITTEADRLMGLLNDTLALSELEHIAMDEKTRSMELSKIAEEAAASLKKQAEKKGVTLSVEGGATLTANENRMKQLLLNLCENAIKYNKEGGSVDVLLSEDQKNAYIEVKDTGIGIPPEEQARVFERFYRAKNSGGATVQGTGLGLAIAKHIAQLYGGSISVHSKLGEGSAFNVTLKKAPGKS